MREFATLVGQAPLNGAKVAVEGWAFSQMPQMYSFHFYLSEKSDVQGSFAQMRREFQSLEQRIGNAGTIAANVIRTWIYCRDIDNNYEGLVIARREYFSQIGLTADTHYIASTGIEGQSEDSSQIVKMDSLGIFGIVPAQMEFMTAPGYMSPTQIYGVTF